MKHEIIIYEDARGRAPLREYLKKYSKRKARKRPTQNFAERNANTKTG